VYASKNKMNMTVNKLKYLNDSDVKGFTTYLSSLINGNREFNHSYETKKPKKKFNFSSFQDAANNYEYHNKNFDKTNAHLKEISSKLQESIENKNEFDTLKSCTDILVWGGVTSGAYGILNLYLNKSLTSSIEGAFQEMQKNVVDFSYFSGSSPKYQMNSSFTKIYALASPNPFIIFDSRVSAAFQLIVSNFLKEESTNSNIPDSLAFPQLESRGSANRLLKGFPRFKSQNRSLHAEWNVKANWIVDASLAEASLKTFCGATERSDQMRAVEAALFMIGYEV